MGHDVMRTVANLVPDLLAFSHVMLYQGQASASTHDSRGGADGPASRSKNCWNKDPKQSYPNPKPQAWPCQQQTCKPEPPDRKQQTANPGPQFDAECGVASNEAWISKLAWWAPGPPICFAFVGLCCCSCWLCLGSFQHLQGASRACFTQANRPAPLPTPDPFPLPWIPTCPPSSPPSLKNEQAWPHGVHDLGPNHLALRQRRPPGLLEVCRDADSHRDPQHGWGAGGALRALCAPRLCAPPRRSGRCFHARARSPKAGLRCASAAVRASVPLECRALKKPANPPVC
jgi:hypothetical protein